MKKIIATFIILIAGISLQAQIEYYEYTLEEPNVGVDIDRYHFGTDIYAPDDINGSPYHNEKYQKGVLYEDNKVLSNKLFFRYNVVGDYIEIKKNINDDDAERKILIKEPLVYVKIANDLLIYNTTSEGYFQVLMLGNNFKLYKKLNKKYNPPRLPRNSFEKEILASYKADPIYYIVSKDENFFELPNTNNKRKKFFASKKIELEKFIEKSQLDLEMERDLIRVFRYFDSFEDINLK